MLAPQLGLGQVSKVRQYILLKFEKNNLNVTGEESGKRLKILDSDTRSRQLIQASFSEKGTKIILQIHIRKNVIHDISQ